MTNKLSAKEKDDLLEILQERFLNHMNRHPGMNWEDIQTRIEAQLDVLWSLSEMERTGGEPDMVGDEYVYMDCSIESPSGRRSICYDREALNARKKNKPENDAMTLVEEMGIEILSEEDYRTLQKFGEFDLKTSSWVETPERIRELGGALYCDRRYNQIFLYHNGADSYYASRGFRGKLKI
jgi:hypothetical protein